MNNELYKIKFIPTGDYYKDLALRESSGDHTKKNEFGYLGLYQLGEDALIDVGYYKKSPTNHQKNKWKGTWTGKYGVKELNDFLYNPIIQHIAIREYHKLIWNIYLKDFHKYLGTSINNIVLTKAGMISAAHLVGHGALKTFIKSKGAIVNKDGNNCSCMHYLSLFAKYSIDYNIEIFLEQLNNMSKPMIKETVTKVLVEVAKTQIVKDTCGGIIKNAMLTAYNFVRTKIFRKKPKNIDKLNRSIDKVELVVNEITNDKNIECTNQLKEIYKDVKHDKKLSADNAKKVIDVIDTGCKSYKNIINKTNKH